MRKQAENSDTASWRTEVLVCPQCGDRLEAGTGDRVFTCKRCETGYELGGDGLRELKANHVYLGWWLRNRPEGPAGADDERIVSLPFWRFELAAPQEKPSAEQQARIPAEVRRQISERSRFDLSTRRVYAYLPAFRTRNLDSAFEAAAAITDTQPEYELNAGARSNGATYGSREAAKLLDAAVVYQAGKSPGLALTGFCRRRPPELIGVPFEVEGGELVEGVSGTHLPLEEIDAALLANRPD
jgi:hypothetical protein